MNNSSLHDKIVLMSSEDKYELLNKIADMDDLTEEYIEILDILSYDKGDEIRTQVAEILGNSESEMAEKILIRLLKDKNGLVRACACDSLYYSNSLDVLNTLTDMIKSDRTDLVRGYAINTVSNILLSMNHEYEEYISFFEVLLNQEKIKWVKLNIYKALYSLGKSEYLFKLLDELKNKQFRKRAFVINLLVDVVTSENRELIKSSLEEILKTEKTTLIRSTIERALEDICEVNS